MPRSIASALAALALVALGLPGCVQLIAFDQAIIGQPDTIAGATSSDVCDRDVQMRASAFCDLSCAIDPSDGASTCGERVRVESGQASVDVAGVYEVELVVNACARADSGWSLADEQGASLSVAERALELRSAAGVSLHRADTHLPEGACAERSVVLQDGRIELVEADRRICDRELPRLPSEGPRRWRLTFGRGVRSIELCLRRPRASS